jgi:hypothetical protein
VKLEKVESWIRYNILKNDKLRRIVYGLYQRTLCAVLPNNREIDKLNLICITPDDKYEWFFGYYDKSPCNQSGNQMLSLRVKDTTTREAPSEEADIMLINVETLKSKKIATSTSWNVQQGCMLQWYTDSSILFNDFRRGKYCSVIKNIDTSEERVIGFPVYSVHIDSQMAISLDFSRLHRLRPGYGYSNIPDIIKNELCPKSTCIWKINLSTGRVTPILKYTDLLAFETKNSMYNAEHKVNHLMISPSGDRFMFLHRWFKGNLKFTRLVTCDMNGENMYNLSDDDFVSHCCWKNNKEILSYLNKKGSGKGYYLLTDQKEKYKKKWPELVFDGHPSYSPDGNNVITDTYPNRRRMQYLYMIKDDKVEKLIEVFSPFKYKGNFRCDLHPRWSMDGKNIIIDSAFSGKRRIYKIDINIRGRDKE